MMRLSQGGGHPYLTRSREAFVLGSGPLCIVMDYCDGGDMAQLIAAQKGNDQPFAESQICLWVLQMLTSVDYLHSHNILHRDIKPANGMARGTKHKHPLYQSPLILALMPFIACFQFSSTPERAS